MFPFPFLTEIRSTCGFGVFDLLRFVVGMNNARSLYNFWHLTSFQYNIKEYFLAKNGTIQISQISFHSKWAVI